MEKYSCFTIKNIMKLLGTLFILWALWTIFVLNGEELLGHGSKEFCIVFISLLLILLPFVLLISFVISSIQVFFCKSIITRKIFKDKNVLQHNRESRKVFKVLQETTYKFFFIEKYLILGALIYAYLYLHF